MFQSIQDGWKLYRWLISLLAKLLSSNGVIVYIPDFIPVQTSRSLVELVLRGTVGILLAMCLSNNPCASYLSHTFLSLLINSSTVLGSPTFTGPITPLLSHLFSLLSMCSLVPTDLITKLDNASLPIKRLCHPPKRWDPLLACLKFFWGKYRPLKICLYDVVGFWSSV